MSRRTVVGSILVVAFFGMLVGWAVSSPVGASPDDDYHLTSIWCSPFSDTYPCTEITNADGGLTLLAPRTVVEAHACFAFQPEVTADCAETESLDRRLTNRVNQIQRLYPPGFYTVHSVFATSDFTASVLRMRLFNAFIASSLVALLLILCRPAIRASALLAIPVMVVPTGLFIVASTNPSSWVVLGTVFFFLFLVNALMRHRQDRSYWASLALAIVCASMAMLSRIDGSAFVVVVSIAAGILMFPRRNEAHRTSWIALIVIGLSALASFFLQGSGPVGSPDRIGDSKYVGGLLFDNILEIPGFFTGIVGLSPLGWSDTRMPGLVSAAALIALGGVLVWGLQKMHRAKTVAVVLLAGATFALPVYVAQQERIAVLDFVQARYLLPLALVLVAVIVGSMPRERREPLSRVPHGVVTALLSVSAVVALWVNFHRYAFGADQPFVSRDMVMAWQGLTGSATVPLLIVASCACVVFFVLAQWMYEQTDDDADAKNADAVNVAGVQRT